MSDSVVDTERNIRANLLNVRTLIRIVAICIAFAIVTHNIGKQDWNADSLSCSTIVLNKMINNVFIC